MQDFHLPALRRNGWNPEIHGDYVLSIADCNGERCDITQLLEDGTLFGADAWVLDPAYHPCKDLIIPSSATETTIIDGVSRYVEALRTLTPPLPWAICISLLEVKGYRLMISNVDFSGAYQGTDLVLKPLIVRNAGDVDNRDKVTRLLRPAIDFIWREFGKPGSPNYLADGKLQEAQLAVAVRHLLRSHGSAVAIPSRRGNSGQRWTRVQASSVGAIRLAYTVDYSPLEGARSAQGASGPV